MAKKAENVENTEYHGYESIPKTGVINVLFDKISLKLDLSINLMERRAFPNIVYEAFPSVHKDIKYGPEPFKIITQTNKSFILKTENCLLVIKPAFIIYNCECKFELRYNQKQLKKSEETKNE